MSYAIKIALFDKTATKNEVIGTNGVALDLFCKQAIVEEDIVNGNNVLDATFIHDKECKVTDGIEKESIIKVKLDYGFEVYRVCKCETTTRSIVIVAQQITIRDLLTCHLDDVRPTNLSAQSFLNYIYTNSYNGKRSKDISFSSNLTGQATSYFIDKNVYQAIWDSDNSLLNQFGGETLRRQYVVRINSKIGVDNNVTIQERKNLLGFESSSNLDTLITRARGKGYNGLKGNWIDSPLINNYVGVYSKTFEYKVRLRVQGEEADADYEYYNTQEEVVRRLDELAEMEFSKNEVDKVRVIYDIDFIELEKTEEYKEYISAERIEIGDTVRVYVESLDCDIKVRLVKRKYDVLSEKVIESTLTNYATSSKISIDKILKDLQDKVNDGDNTNIGEYIAAIMNAGIQNSNVIVRKNEIIVGDTLDINTMRDVWRWNLGGLAHSSNGYYSTNWNIGILQTGEINAELIRTGVLSAILLQSLDGENWIDLSTGEINFNKGVINGLNLKLDLNKGLFETWGLDESDREGRITIGGSKLNFSNWGKIECNNHLNIYGGVKNGESGSSLFLGRGENGAGVATLHSNTSLFLSCNSGEKIIEMRDDFINIEAPRVLINWHPIQTQIAELQNALLIQEGLI